MIRILTPFAAIAAVGCMAPAPPPSGDALASFVVGNPTGPARACVSRLSNSGLTIVDGRTILYREGRTSWVNRLPAACPGLEPLNTLIIESHGSQQCRGDHVRALEPGAVIPGPICILSDWVPYRAR